MGSEPASDGSWVESTPRRTFIASSAAIGGPLVAGCTDTSGDVGEDVKGNDGALSAVPAARRPIRRAGGAVPQATGLEAPSNLSYEDERIPSLATTQVTSVGRQPAFRTFDVLADGSANGCIKDSHSPTPP